MVSGETNAEIADIRGSLWRLLAELRAGEVEPEAAEVQVAVLDSLTDTVRLEAYEAADKRPDEQEAREAEQEAKDGTRAS
jgi:hypothetical protein